MPCPLQPNNNLLKLQIIKPQNLTHFFSCSLLFLSQILIMSTWKTTYHVFFYFITKWPKEHPILWSWRRNLLALKCIFSYNIIRHIAVSTKPCFAGISHDVSCIYWRVLPKMPWTEILTLSITCDLLELNCSFVAQTIFPVILFKYNLVSLLHAPSSPTPSIGSFKSWCSAPWEWSNAETRYILKVI
jgi:hypothetical protein